MNIDEEWDEAVEKVEDEWQSMIDKGQQLWTDLLAFDYSEKNADD
jgi:hypothetical protein